MNTASQPPFTSRIEPSFRSPTASPATPCILVVDDQPANIRVVGTVLGKLGYEILPAADGATALKRLSARLPDLILLDMLMPGLGGCEVCGQIKASPVWQDLPVIFLSAADDKDLIVRALEAGGVDYITKPFNHAELVSRVRTQLALKNARDQLRKLAEDKDELMGILAHDLKNYLGGINMSAELLRGLVQKLNNERAILLSENILRSSAQSLGFVKEFLANAAADHALKLEPAKVNMGEIATDVVRQHAEAARLKNLRLQTEFPEEPVLVAADASGLYQILDNLISNALKFSPPDRRVFVSVRASPGGGECVIRDEGPGFTEADRERMFRRYGRLSARPTGGEPSTGLGLSIVLKLVQGMKGELICESDPGRGAAFTIRLPRPGS
jgi:two-component system, sensor histidine kinase and response regulator